MVPMYPNSTYDIASFAPAFKCTAANQFTVADIDRIDNLTAPSPESYYYLGTPETSYYAFVPAASPNASLVAADFASLPMGWDSIANATILKSPELWNQV